MPIKDPEKRKAAQRAAMAKKRAMAKEGEGVVEGKRSRAWTFILYPESAPADWKEKLEELHIPIAVSPLHDKDINATGEPKKPHYHIALAFKGMKSYSQILEITKAMNSPIPQVCNDLRGMVRYFTHKDNPEKAQYEQKDIVTLSGFDLGEMLAPTATEGFALQMEMLAFCEKYGITEFMDLVTYASHERIDWMHELTRSSFLLKEYIKSRRHSGRNPVNPVTGETYLTEQDKQIVQKEEEFAKDAEKVKEVLEQEKQKKVIEAVGKVFKDALKNEEDN